MPSLTEELQGFFGSCDLYAVLQVSRSSSASEIKRSYYLQSLKVHPDRCKDEDKEVATRKFQAIAKVYTILSDKDKRAVYDETGTIDEDDSFFSDDRDWHAYWRILFAKVTVQDIKEFEAKYKGSEEELVDIKAAYEEHKGSMGAILENVLCATFEDEERFKKILLDLIDKGELVAYKAFTKETSETRKKRKKAVEQFHGTLTTLFSSLDQELSPDISFATQEAAEREAQEAEEHAQALGLSGSGDLKAMILGRQKQREKEMDSFIDGLAAKYAKPASKKNKQSTSRKKK